MEFRILGPLEVLDDGRQLELGAQKQRALLAVLLLEANRVVSSERLVEALWEEEPPERAHKAVQVYVSQLRKEVGRGRLETRPPGYRLRVETGELDLDRFSRLRAEGHPDRALALWRGSPLAEFAQSRFAKPEIAQLEELQLACVEERIERDLAFGLDVSLVAELERLVGAHPLRERMRAQLMLALHRSDRDAEALEVYREGRRLLVEELGIEPSDHLRELQRQILNRNVPLRVDRPLRPRLPERRLPLPSNKLIGRELELAELSVLFRGGDRLVTVTGAGGAGKTRLVLEVASMLAPQFDDHVYFVPLGALRQSHAVPATLAETLGVAVAAGESPLAAAASALRGDTALLVLDNFEQVLDAAPLVTELLAACPLLTVVVTSRATLHLSDEREYPVSPLPLTDAAALFSDLARARRPSFTLDASRAASICARLDCLPLAIELAAAHTRVLSADELLDRLEHRLELLIGGARDLDPRQRTLRAAIEWSHGLLESNEQQAFARMAVFSGGCTLAAAESVCGASLGQLESLADKNLVTVSEEAGETRFSMLETIREFALEQLENAGAVEGVCSSFADYYLALARRRVSQLDQGDLSALTTLERELDNFLAAFEWSHAPDSVPIPSDDGACDHLAGLTIPDLTLDSSQGPINLAELAEPLLVLYIYPGTTRPGRPPLPGLYEIPGGKGCTAENRAFRNSADLFADLGAHLLGLSAQLLEHQLTFAQQSAMPYPIVADPERDLGKILRLPTFDVAGETLYKRVTIVAEYGSIKRVFYPVFPPDRNADDVAAWLAADHPRQRTTPTPATS